jgi:zinc-ribbon domain
MDIGSIFLILGLLVIVAIFISRPFFERSTSEVSQAGHEQSSLLAERDRVLDTLQELDFDYALGKIPEADYPVQRAVLLQEGAQILRLLDTYEAEAPDTAAEARMEAAIAARRVATAPQAAGANGSAIRLVAASPDDNLEALIANRRRGRSEKSSGFCPQCGKPIQQSDRFCPKCGASIV